MQRILKTTFTIIFISMSFLLISCGNSKITTNRYNDISTQEVLAKYQNKESFTFILTLEDCPMCDELYSIMDNDTDDIIHIDYRIKLSKNDSNYKENVRQLKEAFPDIMATPEIIKVKDGNYIKYDDDIETNKLISWFSSNK